MKPELARLYTLAVVNALLFAMSRESLSHCQSGTVCTCPDCPLMRRYRQSHWYIVESESFQACSDESASRAENLARHAESLRSELRPKWLGDVTDAPWTPKCQIVLHGEWKHYVAAVGRGSERTVGSSLIQVDDDRVLSRRIDLLGGRIDFLSAALPHELTHVVLKERFITTTLPRWADEGIAILADPAAKQGKHQADLQLALANGTSFPAATLLAQDDYPRPDRFGIFYGQSASLTEFLVRRKTPQEFLNFIERAGVVGYDAALRSCYGIENIRELDREWRAALMTARHSNDRSR
jgi:hypothetical protein